MTIEGIATTGPDDPLCKAVRTAINERIVAIADEYVEAKVDEFRTKLRVEIGKHLIGVIESSYSMERFGGELRIIVHQNDGA